MSAVAEDDDRWFDWQAHDGKGCPLPVGTLAQIEGETYSHRPRTAAVRIVPGDMKRPSTWHAADFGKPHPGGGVFGRILRYRARRYAAADRLIAEAKTASGSTRSDA